MDTLALLSPALAACSGLQVVLDSLAGARRERSPRGSRPLSDAGSQIASVARQAGVPLLIDPETTYLQDVQHLGAPWCRVPYAHAPACTAADLSSAAAQAALVKAVVDYLIQQGATAVLAPYVHVETPTSGWAAVQAGLWRQTATYVAQAHIYLPVIAVVAVGCSPSAGHPGPRGVYLSELGRAVPKRRLELARNKRTLWARVICPFPDCCAPSGYDLLADARRHSVIARARTLEQLDATQVSGWRWHQLADRLSEGLITADQLNGLTPRSPAVPAIDTTSLRALQGLASARRSRRIVQRTA